MNNDLISRKALIAEFEWLKQNTGAYNHAALDEHIVRIKRAPAVEYYGNIDVSANAVFDGMTRADGPRFRETDEMCPQCQRDLEVYYCENRTYAVRCRHCHIVTLVQAKNPDEAAEKVGLHVKLVRLGRWITDRNNSYSFCSECKTQGSPRWKCCPVCEAKMDLEVQNNVD